MILSSRDGSGRIPPAVSLRDTRSPFSGSLCVFEPRLRTFMSFASGHVSLSTRKVAVSLGQPKNSNQKSAVQVLFSFSEATFQSISNHGDYYPTRPGERRVFPRYKPSEIHALRFGHHWAFLSPRIACCSRTHSVNISHTYAPDSIFKSAPHTLNHHCNMAFRFLFLALVLTARATALRLHQFAPRSTAGFCLESDAWPIGPGSLITPQAPQAELVNMLAQIDEQRINETITSLVAFGTRNTLSTQTDPARGIGAARDWIAARMRNLTAGAAFASVSVPSYIQQPVSEIPFAVNISNVVTTIRGTDEPNRVYIITGHYDSRNSDVDDFTADAPGADDDASGVAVRVLWVRCGGIGLMLGCRLCLNLRASSHRASLLGQR
jgi:hypothetical protein